MHHEPTSFVVVVMVMVMVLLGLAERERRCTRCQLPAGYGRGVLGSFSAMLHYRDLVHLICVHLQSAGLKQVQKRWAVFVSIVDTMSILLGGKKC